MIKSIFIAGTLLICLLSSCNTNAPGNTGLPKQLTDGLIKTDSLVYESRDLIIRKISPHVFVHTSYLNTETFGKVPCNGLVVTGANEAIIFDTPADEESSEELIEYLTKTLRYVVKAVVPTHFHQDCLGGLRIFTRAGIPSFSNEATIAALKRQNPENSLPLNAFKDSLTLEVGKEKIWIKFFGEGHTKDNVVAWFPSEKILFGGCLIKEPGAGKGNLEDANVKAWPVTVEKIKHALPDLNVVVPGHGEWGDKALLDYTIQLFREKNEK